MVSIVNNWSSIAAKLKPALQQGIKVVATNVQVNAQQNAPYVTGFMSNNVYASGWWGSDYGQGGEPPGDAYLLDEVAPENDLQAIVGAAANYSIFVEMGHHTRSGSFVPAQPWFIPAIEQAASTMEDDMAQALAEGLV